MARPKATVLLEIRERGTYINEEVLEGNNLFAVYYNGKPMRLRTSTYKNERYDYKPTYYYTTYMANKLADRLNKKFFTDEFTVVRLGEIEDE